MFYDIVFLYERISNIFNIFLIIIQIKIMQVMIDHSYV